MRGPISQHLTITGPSDLIIVRHDGSADGEVHIKGGNKSVSLELGHPIHVIENVFVIVSDGITIDLMFFPLPSQTK